MSAPSAANDSQGSWGSILLIYFIGVLGATTISQAVTVARDIAAFFQAAPQQAGWIISTPSALVAIGALLTGALVDRFGDKGILLIGCVIVIAGDVGVAFATSMENFLIMRVVEGVGYVGIAVSAVTMLARTTSGPRRNIALTLWSSFIPMSFALPLLLTAKLAGTGEWRWAFTGHAIVLGACAALALITLPASGGVAAARTAGLATVLRRPGPYLLGLAFAAAAFIQTGIVTTLSLTLSGYYPVSFPVASSIGTLGMLFNTIGCLVVGPMMNRGVRPLFIAIAGVLGMIVCGIAVGLKMPGFATAVIVASVFFFAAGLVVGLWALLPQVAPSREAMGATSGLVTQITLWGVLFGPPAAFAAQATGDWTQQATNVIAAGALTIVMLWLVVGRTSRTNASEGVSKVGQAVH